MFCCILYIEITYNKLILSHESRLFLNHTLNRRVAVTPFRFEGFSPTFIAITPYEY
nr:MAG TPA: hypothetical protein [Bacteriophage sp.]